MAEKLATLSFSDGKPSIDFPVLGGTMGPEVIDALEDYLHRWR
jgi:citrate synthase